MSKAMQHLLNEGKLIKTKKACETEEQRHAKRAKERGHYRTEKSI